MAFTPWIFLVQLKLQYFFGFSAIPRNVQVTSNKFERLYRMQCKCPNHCAITPAHETSNIFAYNNCCLEINYLFGLQENKKDLN